MSKDVGILVKPNGLLNRRIETAAKECDAVLKEAKELIKSVGVNPRTIVLEFGTEPVTSNGTSAGVNFTPNMTDTDLVRAMDLLMQQNPINTEDE